MTALTHPGRLPPGFSFASSSCLRLRYKVTFDICMLDVYVVDTLWIYIGHPASARPLWMRFGASSCVPVPVPVLVPECACGMYLFCMHTAASERRPIANCRTYRMGGHLPTMSFSFSLVWEQCGSGTIFTPALSHSERALFRPFYPDYTVVA